MIKRLGFVLYWISVALALAVVCIGIFGFFSVLQHGQTEAFSALGFFAFVALLIFLLGKACRFILVGPTETSQVASPKGSGQESWLEESNKKLREINKSLGFPPGTGPTGFIVDGQYKIANVGHSERMESDPTYAWGYKAGGSLLKMQELETKLNDAISKSDFDLADKIKRELDDLAATTIREAEALKQRKAAAENGTSQRESNLRQESTNSITMADVVEARKRLMGHWEAALKVARATGYWADVDAGAHVIDAFHNKVADVINSGAFSGDKASALAAWDTCRVKEQEYQKIVQAEARLNAPKPDGTAWWEILGVAPSAADDVVRKAYADRLKQCQPDTVKELNRAFEEAQHRPAWWHAQ